MATILVVDDQACIREVISEELASEGHLVTLAGDAESVKGHVRFSEPDLVLLDLYLDGPDGISVLHDLKRQYPDLPVIIFTAYDSY
ncbi:MAG: response regulator, partial [Deltaproteobacteria bacterium]|nr:response regulator [Deltaproteobacteria bacterium]